MFESAEKCQGVGAKYPHIEQPPSRLGLAVENDDTVASSAADHLYSFALGSLLQAEFAGAFDKDFHFSTDKRLIIFKADGVLYGQQLVISPPFDSLRYVIGEFFGGGAWTRAVFENEAVLESGVANQLDGLCKILFALTTKAHDKIAGNLSLIHI